MDNLPDTHPRVRAFLSSFCAEVPPEHTDRIPPGMNNNLRWHLGHLVGVFELLTIGHLDGELSFPREWTGYFGRGTSPRDFDAGTPDWVALRAALDRSTDHLRSRLDPLPSETALARVFEIPQAGVRCETLGQVFAMATFHETLHLGMMRSMRQVLGA